MKNTTNRPDSVVLFVFDIQMDFVFVSEFQGCVGCCAKAVSGLPKKIHAHIDPALNTLYLFSDTHMFNITLDDLVSHQQHEDYQVRSFLGGLRLPAFFQHPQRRIVQVASASQVPFAMLTNIQATQASAAQAEFSQYAQNWQAFYVMTQGHSDAKMGLLYVARKGRKLMTNVQTQTPFYTLDGATSDPQTLEYIELLDNAVVLHELKTQIQKRHYEGVDISAHSQFDAMQLQGFSLLNDVKRVVVGSKRLHSNHSATIHVIISHIQARDDVLRQDNDVLHDQILSFVDIRVAPTGASTISVRLLTVLTHPQQQTPHSFFYTIMPYRRDTDSPNNILARGVVATMLQRGNSNTVMVSNFSCLMCGANLYDAATETCSCSVGTVPVCLPCFTDCATGRFMVEPSPSLCHKATRSLPVDASSVTRPSVAAQRYNLVCMPCTGTFFCKNGRVDGMAQCPPTSPYTLQVGAAGDYACSCPPDFAPSVDLQADYTVHGALLQHNTIISRLPKNIFEVVNETCSQCPATLVCTPLYTQHARVLLCPAFSMSQTHHVKRGGDRPGAWQHTAPENSDDSVYNNIYQGCFCVRGYYRTYHTSESYLLDSANFIYQYAWDNNALTDRSIAGNTRVHLQVELCQLCEAGWACQDSVRRQCEPLSSTSTAGSFECTCRPGFARNGVGTCGHCPAFFMCPGGDEAPIACPLPRQSALQSYCPCEAGRILDTLTWECQVCPRDFYCPGFANMSGVTPSHTVYARRCPVGATSAAGSRALQDCFCKKGYYIAHAAQKDAQCVPCAEGYYCPGQGVSRAKCPEFTTTNASRGAASSITDCVCANPRMQLVAVGSQYACVCSAGWLASRYNAKLPYCVF